MFVREKPELSCSKKFSDTFSGFYALHARDRHMDDKNWRHDLWRVYRPLHDASPSKKRIRLNINNSLAQHHRIRLTDPTRAGSCIVNIPVTSALRSSLGSCFLSITGTRCTLTVMNERGGMPLRKHRCMSVNATSIAVCACACMVYR